MCFHAFNDTRYAFVLEDTRHARMQAVVTIILLACLWEKLLSFPLATKKDEI